MESKKTSRKLSSIFWFVLYSMPLLVLLITYIGYLNIYKENGNVPLDEEITYNEYIISNPVPSEGSIENIYINLDLSVSEVDNLLSQLTFFGVIDETDNSITYMYKALCTENYKIIILKAFDGFIIVNLENSLFIYNSSNFEGIDFIGFNPVVPNCLPINENAYIDNENIPGLENDKISSLFSITPFEIGKEEIIKYNSLYDLTLKHTYETFNDKFIWQTFNDVLNGFMVAIGFNINGYLGNFIMLCFVWFIQTLFIKIFIDLLTFIPGVYKKLMERWL